MKSLYGLSEERALGHFRYNREIYSGLICDYDKSPMKYLLGLLAWGLFFGSGLQVFTMFGYVKDTPVTHPVMGRIYSFDNPYTRLLFSLRFFLMGLTIVFMVVLFTIYILFRKSRVYQFKSLVQQCMLALALLCAGLTVIFSVSLSINQFRYAEFYYLLILLLILIRSAHAIRNYRDQLYEEEGKGEAFKRRDRLFTKIFTFSLALCPLYVFLRALSRSLLKVRCTPPGDFLRAAGHLFLLLLPYLLILKPEIVVYPLLYGHLREYYIVKYPEAFRKEDPMTEEEFYGG